MQKKNNNLVFLKTCNFWCFHLILAVQHDPNMFLTFYKIHPDADMLEQWIKRERETYCVCEWRVWLCLRSWSKSCNLALCVFVSLCECVCVQYTVEEGLTDCLPIEVWPLLSVEHYKPQRCTLQSSRILTRPSPAVLAVSLCPRWGCETEDFTAMSM